MNENEIADFVHSLNRETKTGNVRIEVDGWGKGHFYIDGNEIPRVLGYSISHRALERPVIHIDVCASSLTFNASNTLPKLPAPWNVYYEPKEQFKKISFDERENDEKVSDFERSV